MRAEHQLPEEEIMNRTQRTQLLVSRPAIRADGDRTDCDICHTWNASSQRIGNTFLCQECVNEIAKAATSA